MRRFLSVLVLLLLVVPLAGCASSHGSSGMTANDKAFLAGTLQITSTLIAPGRTGHPAAADLSRVDQGRWTEQDISGGPQGDRTEYDIGALAPYPRWYDPSKLRGFGCIDIPLKSASSYVGIRAATNFPNPAVITVTAPYTANNSLVNVCGPDNESFRVAVWVVPPQ